MKDLMKLDLYELLNIKSTAAESEIKKAYRKKALTCHPDKNPGNPKAVEDFKQLSKAVEILTDRAQRADYDKILRERKAAYSKIIYVRLSQVIPPSYYAAWDKEEQTKKARRQESKKRHPTRAPSSSKAQDKNENGPKQNTNSERDFPFEKAPPKPAPTWPPAFSKTQAGNESIFRQSMRKDCPVINRFRRSAPTCPPSTSKTQPRKEGISRLNRNFKCNYSTLIKPATFVAPTMSDASSNNSFTFPGNQNHTDGSSVFSPFKKPATYVGPSDNKASTGFSWGSSSPILKPATFIPPSKS